MRTLFIGLWSEGEPQTGMRRALAGVSSRYQEIQWSKPKYLANQIIMQARASDIIFMQIQRAGVVDKSLVKQLHEQGKLILNFTGDVRLPIPQWYRDIAPYCHTLFSDNHSALEFQSKGYSASYFPIAYDPAIYNPQGEVMSLAPIVFMGNHYAGAFPLSEYRWQAVQMLNRVFGNNYRTFGTGYPHSINLNFKQSQEASVYRGAKIGINISHFAINRYTSDRMLRIMGCGCMCITHWYPDIEKDFTPDKHVVVFRSLKELEDRLKYYMIHTGERDAIAAEGHKLVAERDTWKHRFANDLKAHIYNEGSIH